MISRFLLHPETARSFPRDLLSGSRETVRMAERILRELGFSEFDYRPPVPLSERLTWAIAAMEGVEPGDPPDGAPPPDR